MNILLLIISHICVAIITGCSVSIYKDYKAGDELVCRNIKQLKKSFVQILSGIVASAFGLVFTLTFVFLWLVG